MKTQQILQGVHDWTNGKIVYDISVAHPDGQGNPTPYIDLAAALGTGGANIPKGLRKGGMSVKFIQGTAQSSDNNYVRFCYMGTAVTGDPNPFLDTANWQSINVDDEPTDGSNNLVKSGGIYTWVMGLIATIKEWAEGLFAKMDGYYESMTVGRADNLIGEPIPVTTGYTLKATGYDPTQPELEFADGPVKMTEIRGRACAWNQLNENSNLVGSKVGCTVSYNSTTKLYTLRATNATGQVRVIGARTLNFIPNHKYLFKSIVKEFQFANRNISQFSLGDLYNQSKGKLATGTKIDGKNAYLLITIPSSWSSSDSVLTYIDISIGSIEHTTADYCIFNYNIIDVTLLNPTLAAKSNLTVAEVEAYIASIRTPKPYYARNAGTLLGARMMGWQLRKTANLLNPTTKQAKLFEYSYTGHNNEYTVTGFDGLTNAALQFTPYATGVAEAVTIDANNRFVISSDGVLEVVASGGDITGDISRVCVVATYDGSMDNVYSAYEENNIEIDSANIYYDNNGTKTQVFADGILRSTGDGSSDVHDRVYFDDVAKKWIAEINTTKINFGTASWELSITQNCFFLRSGLYDSKNINARYKTVYLTMPSNQADKTICLGYYGDGPGFVVKDTSYSSLADFKASLAGVMCYVSRSPITRTDLYYKVGEDEYVPMEQVFPDGIQGLWCNWSSENLVEQAEVSGQPQSITPQTTEVFQSDMKELLKTVGDTYISKEQAKDSFDNLLTQLNTNSGTALGGSYETDGFNSDGTIKFKFTANEE